MPSLKDIRKRIGSVKNTQKITKAMKMVAAAKLRRAQEAVVATRPYAAKLTEMIGNLVGQAGDESHVLMRKAEDPERCRILVISGDRGLCGAYNTNANKLGLQFYNQQVDLFNEVKVDLVGSKARDFFSKRPAVEVNEVVEDGHRGNAMEVCTRLAEGYVKAFSEGELDEVYVVYTQFRSAIAQEVVVDQLLPLRGIDNEGEDEGPGPDYIYEPDAASLLDSLLPRSVFVQIYRSLLESQASEHGARMTAMDNATSNAGEMIDSLTLQYNRARQASITKELIEIISGAEAV